MARQIFINLPVTDLERSKRFYQAIGARNEPKFTDANAAMMVLSDSIHIMLLRHDFYATFTAKPIADAHAASAVILCVSCESARAVDAMVDAAASAGGKADPGPKQDISGMIYGRSFEDPDGHHWEPMWMDPKAVQQGASAFENQEA